MPLVKTEKEKFLQRLREEYDVLDPYDPKTNGVDNTAIFERKLEKLLIQIEEHPSKEGVEYDTLLSEIKRTEWRIAELNKQNWKTPSRTFAEKTKKDVAQIVNDGLNRNVKDQYKRFREYRESYGLTPKELADIIGVDREMIRRLEKPSPNLDGRSTRVVNPFYLEALSLIYYEDPYTLLGLMPALIRPLRMNRTTHADYIMNALMVYSEEKMVKYLQAFRKIAMLTKGRFDELCKFLDQLSAFNHIKCNLENICFGTQFVQKPVPIDFPLNKRESPECKRAEFIQAVYYEIKALDTTNHNRLHKLALWTSGGEKILEVLYSLLILGGFPERKDSVKPSASEEEYGYLSIHYVASMRRAVDKKVFHNGNVYTGAGFVQAFAVEAGRFTFVGSDADSLFVAGEPINLHGAFVCAGFEEHIKGQIKPGQCANFVVLGADPFHTDPDKLKDIPILQTWLNGELIP